MAVSKPLYGTNNQPITVTLTSLANNGVQGSVAIDLTSILALDLVLMALIKTNGAGTSATGYINIWLHGTVDGGSHYADLVTGTNASQTLSSPPNASLIGEITANANATQYASKPINIAAFLGGVPTDHVVVSFENKTGASLDPSVGNAWFQTNQIQTA